MDGIDLDSLTRINGFLRACLVDSSSGMAIASIGPDTFSLDVAAAGNTTLVRLERKTIRALGLSDRIEDILIVLEDQYHIIRPLESPDTYFLYLALDRAQANLGLARFELAEFASTLYL